VGRPRLSYLEDVESDLRELTGRVGGIRKITKKNGHL
jgi:hypothetical protein